MLWRRLVYLLPWQRRAAERDLRDELASIAAMAPPGELGNLTLAAEDARAELGWTRLDQTVQDLRYAVRTLARSPGFTVTAILSLALGIGANTALFTVVDAVSWRMLPVRDPQSLLMLQQREGTTLTSGFTYQQYLAIHDHIQVVDLAAYGRARLNVAIDGHLEANAEGLLVSGGYFPLLGVAPSVGRALGPSDDRLPLAHPVVMLSHGYWKRRFALDPGVLGRTVAISGTSFTVVGVTPPAFFGVEVGSAPDFFVPLMMQPAVMPVSENLLAAPINGVSWLRLLARLAPGVQSAQAHAALGSLAPGVEWRPRDKRGVIATDVTLELAPAATGSSDLRQQFSTPVRILMGVVGIVLLIACANVGNLVLARSASRRSEFALRLALGAGRSRLLRQVLVEGLVLAGVAGGCGIALAWLATEALVTFVSAGRTPLVLDLAPDGRVLAFTASVSVFTGLLFASVPAFRASRIDMAPMGSKDLAGTRHRAGASQPGRWLVVAQVALSLLLLIASGLFVRSLQNLQRQDAGIDRHRILTVRVEPRGSDQRNIAGVSERLDAIYRDLLARVERLPGVESASLAHSAPLSPIPFASPVTGSSGTEVKARILMTYPGYFATMGVPVLRGRDFDHRDLRPGAARVALANETFVRQALHGQDPVASDAVVTAGRDRFAIIGVVKDTRLPDLRSTPVPVLYQTFLQTHTGRGQMVLHVRVTGDAARLVPEIRAAVQAIDKDVPTFEIRSLAEEIDGVFVQERLVATLSGFFGVLALTLVCVGLYGLMSFTVARRTSEIGVRVALGAASSNVSWLIVRQTLALALAGILVGLPLAYAAAKLASHQLSVMLFDLTPGDPLTIGAATALLIVIAVSASAIPARRAARINPAVALRNE
jgi:predicted permease